jgi:hypothetical protein
MPGNDVGPVLATGPQTKENETMGFAALKKATFRDLIAGRIPTDPNVPDNSIAPRAVLRYVAKSGTATPPGWQRIQRDATRLLAASAQDAAHRRFIRVTWCYFDGQQPRLMLNVPDQVTFGIVRRLLARARSTCCRCGRWGRPWHHLPEHVVLCPTCAALSPPPGGPPA